MFREPTAHLEKLATDHSVFWLEEFIADSKSEYDKGIYARAIALIKDTTLETDSDDEHSEWDFEARKTEKIEKTEARRLQEKTSEAEEEDVSPEGEDSEEEEEEEEGVVDDTSERKAPGLMRND